MSKRLVIPLLGKGATNHLHRPEIVAAFSCHNLSITFLVREDYAGLINKIAGCEYLPYNIPAVKGYLGALLDFFVNLRYQYPSTDAWRQWRFKTIRDNTPRLISRIYQRILFLAAFSKTVMNVAVAIEGMIYRMMSNNQELDRVAADVFLVLGAGTWADTPSCRIVWYAESRNIPVVNFVANYDGLCSKGYRGVPVKSLLVWGSRMQEDAVRLHDIDIHNVHAVGSLRYNMIDKNAIMDRTQFFSYSGLNPEAKTIVFAGSAYYFHYFEMIAAFDELRASSASPMQLVIRIYPNRELLRSGYVSVLLDYAKTRKDIWISLGDPLYGKRSTDEEVLQIDEYELWSLLQHSDVVVNIYSTLTIEACIFDKPVINMWYFIPEQRVMKQAVYYPYPFTQHIRRIESSHVAVTVSNRVQLLQALEECLEAPQLRQKERMQCVEAECGKLDGLALDRVADVVVEAARLL